MERLLGALVLLILAGCANQASSGASSPCATDPGQWVRSQDGGCLAMQAYGPATADVLVVVLHGDISDGGPATYHRALARRVADTLPGAATVALVRPGYPDGEGRTSDGSANGRSDHYTEANIDLVSGAVAALRSRTGAKRVIAIGHSGGSATAADILALHPGTIDSAVLLACPCDLSAWRANRRPWTMSVSPQTLTGRVPRTAQVAAYTGSADTNTSPSLARAYAESLAARGLQASFTLVPDATHNSVVDAVWTLDLAAMLRRMAQG